jgi:hypothetical protein
MYLKFRKPYRKPVSHSNEIDLLLHFPFGSLIGGELLPHAKIPTDDHKISAKAKPVNQKRIINYQW